MTSAPPLPRRKRRAFTLVEMVVVVVLVAVLLAVCAVGYRTVINHTFDSGTKVKLHQVVKVAAAEAVRRDAGAVAYTLDDFGQGAKEVTAFALGADPVERPLAADSRDMTAVPAPAESTDPTKLSVALSVDGMRAGLALRSPTEHCFVGRVEHAKVTVRETPLTEVELGQRGGCVGVVDNPASPGGTDPGDTDPGGTDPGDTDPGGDGPEGEVPAPTGVTAKPGVPDSETTHVTWNPVPTADVYCVFVDDAMVDCITPTDPNHPTFDMPTPQPPGGHRVHVTARRGSDTSGPSKKYDFTTGASRCAGGTFAFPAGQPDWREAQIGNGVELQLTIGWWRVDQNTQNCNVYFYAGNTDQGVTVTWKSRETGRIVKTKAGSGVGVGRGTGKDSLLLWTAKVTHGQYTPGDTDRWEIIGVTVQADTQYSANDGHFEFYWGVDAVAQQEQLEG